METARACGCDDPVLAVRHGGKPFFEVPKWLKLSVSDTGKVAYLAVGGIELGFDLEFASRSVSAGAIARRYFHSDEYHWLERQPVTQQKTAFLRLWTAKEAAVKLSGEGIYRGLSKVRLFPGRGRLAGRYAGRGIWFRQVFREDGLIATIAAFEDFTLAAGTDFQLSVGS